MARYHLSRMAWITFGGLALLFGLVGVVLPILPTTPFLIVAAFAFSKSSPTLRDWLINHAVFGPPIRDWERSGAIRPRYKGMACTAMALVFCVSLLAGVPSHVILIQAIALGGAATFILTRPNGD